MAERRNTSSGRPVPAGGAVRAEVEAFLEALGTVVAPAPRPQADGAGGGGRLLFAMDATASRRPTWDRAAELQAEMFQAAAGLGGLSVQLCFYRGFGEFKVSPWLADPARLVRLMTSVDCRAGRTQIGRVLAHAINETGRRRLGAVVFVGDCMEEDVDALGTRAGELGVLGVPVFLFHEGGDPLAAFAFEQIARLSGGAACRFDASSPETLRALLCAVAVFAAGGRQAFERYALAQGGALARLVDRTGGT